MRISTRSIWNSDVTIRRAVVIAGLAAGLALAGQPPVAAQSIVGTVTFAGTPPAPETVTVHQDTSVCGAEKQVQTVAVDPSGGLANVVARVLDAAGSITPGRALLDQVHCEFSPRVLALPVGSTLDITSSDNVLHNSHAFREDKSTEFNIAVPIRGMKVSHKLDQPGRISLKCDAGHTWMAAYVFVVDSPYYAVTEPDGTFRIDGVPAGDHELELWHETLGTVVKRVTVPPSGEVTLDVALSSQ